MYCYLSDYGREPITVNGPHYNIHASPLQLSLAKLNCTLLLLYPRQSQYFKCQSQLEVTVFADIGQQTILARFRYFV